MVVEGEDQTPCMDRQFSNKLSATVSLKVGERKRATRLRMYKEKEQPSYVALWSS